MHLTCTWRQFLIFIGNLACVKYLWHLSFEGGRLALLSLGRKHLNFYFILILVTKNHIIKYTINLVNA